MKDPAARGARVLVIDRDGECLPVIQRAVAERCLHCIFEMASDCESASRLIHKTTYDLVVLDTGTESGRDLLDLTSIRGLPVLALFSRRTRPETLRNFCTPEVHAFICKDRHGEVADAIERIMCEQSRPWWQQTIRKLFGGAAEPGPGRGWSDPAPLIRSDRDIYGLIKTDPYVCQ